MEIKILGSGLSCIDVIKYVDKTKIALGGTAANVMSFLASFNAFNVNILLPKINDNFIANELKKRNLRIMEFGEKDVNPPIIIENLTDESHCFNSSCPYCNMDLKIINLPSVTDASSVYTTTDYYNLFFYDRISTGIQKIAQKNIKGWNYYEPNSLGNYKTFIECAKFSNIIKFSADRIPETQIQNILFDLQASNVSIIIITMGAAGLKYSIRINGILSEWIHVKSHLLNNIKDASGAGDWLSTVFLFLLLNEYPLYTDKIDKDIILEFLDKSKKIATESCRYVGAHGLLENKQAIENVNRILHTKVSAVDVLSDINLCCPYCRQKL